MAGRRESHGRLQRARARRKRSRTAWKEGGLDVDGGCERARSILVARATQLTHDARRHCTRCSIRMVVRCVIDVISDVYRGMYI